MSEKYLRLGMSCLVSSLGCRSLILVVCLILSPGASGAGSPRENSSNRDPDATPAVRTDRYGDPLPPGAIARLGMARLWHRSRVLALVFSRDGRTVISGGSVDSPEDGKSDLALWDVGTGKRIRSLQGLPFGISSLALSPDGALLASENGSCNVWVYDLHTDSPVRKLELEGNSSAVACSPDGKTMAAVGPGSPIHIWDISTGKVLRRFGDKDGGRSLAYSPDGKTLASGADSIQLWDVATGREVWGLPLQVGYNGLAFSPDGKSLAVGSERLHLLASDSGKELRSFPGGEPAFSPDGKLLASGRGDIQLWDVATRKELHHLQGHRRGIDKLVFSPAGRTLASAGQDQTVRLWDVATGKELFPRGGHDDLVLSVAFSPDGKTLASGGCDDTVRLWDPRTGAEVRSLPSHPGPVVSASFSPDGKTLTSVSQDGTLRLWAGGRGEERRLLRGHHAGIVTTAYSPDGRVLACANTDHTIRLWDLVTGQELRRLEEGKEQESATSLAFSPDGRLLASGRGDRTVRLCDVMTGQEVGRLTVQDRDESGITAVAFSPDGRVLATGSRDGKLRLWEAAGRKELFQCPERDVYSLSFSPDGRLLATAGGKDGSVGLWEVASGREVRRWRGHQGEATGVAFAPDGRCVASGSRDFTILLWDVTGLLSAEGRLPERTPTEDGLAKLWRDLAEPDAPKASRAEWLLVAAGDNAVRFLGTRLAPVPADMHERIGRWIIALDDDDFAAREKATRELEEDGELAEPALRQVLQDRPSAETRRRVTALLEQLSSHVPLPHRLRETRALAVLEQVGTPEAREVLRQLAQGEPEARQTREAKVALRRMAGR